MHVRGFAGPTTTPPEHARAPSGVVEYSAGNFRALVVVYALYVMSTFVATPLYRRSASQTT